MKDDDMEDHLSNEKVAQVPLDLMEENSDLIKRHGPSDNNNLGDTNSKFNFSNSKS